MVRDPRGFTLIKPLISLLLIAMLPPLSSRGLSALRSNPSCWVSYPQGDEILGEKNRVWNFHEGAEIMP
jgi:type II secretory pathway component PulJ